MINETLRGGLDLNLSQDTVSSSPQKRFLSKLKKNRSHSFESNYSLEKIKKALVDFDVNNGDESLNNITDITTIKKDSSINSNLIKESFNDEAHDFFKRHVDLSDKKSLILSKNKRLMSYSNLNNIENIVVLNRMNDLRKINKYFEEINEQLQEGDFLLGSFETFRERMSKSRFNTSSYVGKLYANYEFIFKRVIPKLPYFKNLYFGITKGKNRLLSKAEALGRLVSCGFEIVDIKIIDGIYYYVAKKIKQPAYDMNPSYGPLFKMKRVGKDGKIIGVYKFRTMHPYSEYLQEYIVKKNGYSETGKPANDFRVVPWAKTLRRYWIDELPQLINVLKGEMKLVGIRPVSKTYFDSSIPKDIQQLRLTQKPGCIPPYVALNRMSSVDSVLEAEREYLEQKIKNPYFTDTKFFFKAIYNIVFKRKRSA